VNRTEKQETVDALVKDFDAHSVVFALDYRGLKVEEATDLRRKIRETGGKYRVIKNTLALRALQGLSSESLGAHFKGMTGVAYTDSDPVALAKVLNDFSKDVPALAYKGGVMSGKELDESQFKALASLPGRNELYAQLLSVLQAPMRNLLSVFSASARDLILVLKAAADKKKTTS
jgi:large subunit ribosomal protein L10